LTQNKDFRTVFPISSTAYCRVAMQNPRRVSDLLSRTGNKLTALKARSAERSLVVEQVRAALPARLAMAVVSAGVEQGRLTIGVAGAVWASRLRYLTEYVRKRVGSTTGIAIVSVRIRVVPPLPAQPLPAKPLPAKPRKA
jgi:Dna[CI] antecedent, DciA